MACIRRVVIAALLALASLCAIDARAQESCWTMVSGGSCADQGEAWAASHAVAQNWISTQANPSSYVICPTQNSGAVDAVVYSNSCTGVLRRHNVKYFPAGATCSARPDEHAWMPPGGTAGPEPVCFNGCRYDQVLDGGSGETFYSATGGNCQVNEFPVPEVDTDGDGVPDTEDAFPEDPNETSDIDGDGIGDNSDTAPDDATNGEDDGEGNESDNTATGGGDCKSPPSCNGDGIQCNQLYQQWHIRCKGVTLTGDPSVCGAGYSCAGDVAQCAMIALQRKTACNTEGLGEGGEGGAQGDANGNGVPDVLEGSGTGDTGDPGEDVDPTRFGLGVNPNMLDQENIFGGGQCPEPPSFSIMGVSINGGDMPYWCNAMAIARACILIFGTWMALQILLGRGFE